MTKAVLVDVTRCIGCRGCQVACKRWNDLKAEETALTNCWTNPPDLTAETWTHVKFRLIEGESGDVPIWRFAKVQCKHCLEPACVSACFVAALRKTEDGATVWDETRCVGCRYCMVACPFGVPKFEWDSSTPRIRKCRFCYDRISEGKEPACVSACPTGALTFGERDALIQEARSRIEKGNGKYLNHIYGEEEAGGTSWMYISDISFELIDANAFPTTVPNLLLPSITRGSLEKIPIVVVGLAAGLGAMAWYTERRNKLGKTETRKTAAEKVGGEG